MHFSVSILTIHQLNYKQNGINQANGICMNCLINWCDCVSLLNKFVQILIDTDDGVKSINGLSDKHLPHTLCILPIQQCGFVDYSSPMMCLSIVN